MECSVPHQSAVGIVGKEGNRRRPSVQIQGWLLAVQGEVCKSSEGSNVPGRDRCQSIFRLQLQNGGCNNGRQKRSLSREDSGTREMGELRLPSLHQALNGRACRCLSSNLRKVKG